jgi:serine protease Do
MNALAAGLAVLMAAAPALAAPKDTDEAALRRAADQVLSMSDQAFAELDAQAPEDAEWKSMDRASLAATAYRSLAARRYQQALDAGLPPELDKEARAALDKIKSSPADESAGKLVKTGWWTDINAWANQQSQPRYRATAVAAVRGGREVSAQNDPEIAKLLSSADASEKGLGDEGMTPVKRAQTLMDTARDYAGVADRVAASASRPAAVSTQTAAAAPAAPAAPALTAAEIYRRDAPSVVVILAARDSGRGELGTGSVIGGGRVLTNAHVVVDDQTGRPYPRIRVYLKPARLTGSPSRDLKDPIQATVARYDRALDLAVLSLSREPAVAPLELGDDSGVQPGESVVAIGHPEQGGLWTLTKGVVSTVKADLGGVPGKDVFQTDASINRGNSGGPLIAPDGSIIGVNTSMARKAADGLAITSVNFSIKSDVVRRWLGQSGPSIASAPAAEPAAPDAGTAASEPQAAPAVPDLPAPKTQPVMVTPAKPYDIDDVLEAEMKQMDEMGEEMHEEIQRRATELQQP